MTKSEWNRLAKILDVLEGASDLRVAMRDESIFLNGKNSPYATHVRFNVDYGSSHKCPETIILQAAHARLVLCPDHYESCYKIINCVVLRIPTYMVKFVTKFIKPFELPAWTKDGTITAIFPDRFSGYGADGKPCWNSTSVCQRKNIHDVWTSFFDYVEIEETEEIEKAV